MNGNNVPHGRIFYVHIEGAKVTLKDTIVVAHTYLDSLQKQFDSVRQMVRSFKAAHKQKSIGYIDVTDEELREAQIWEAAHRDADRIARPSLSAPHLQRFVFVLSAELL